MANGYYISDKLYLPSTLSSTQDKTIVTKTKNAKRSLNNNYNF